MHQSPHSLLVCLVVVFALAGWLKTTLNVKHLQIYTQLQLTLTLTASRQQQKGQKQQKTVLAVLQTMQGLARSSQRQQQ